jgi:hypothetical protein
MYTADQLHRVIVAHVLSTGNGYQMVAMETNVQLTMTCTVAVAPLVVVKEQ